MTIQKITTLAIEDNAVTEPKVAPNSLDSADIASSAITTTKIANNAVTTAKLDSTGIAPTINGGTINNTVIGGVTPAAGSFTTVAASTPIPITSGGTGASDAINARSNLGLGNAATKNTGTTASDVAAGNHDHTGVYEPADATILKSAAIGVSVQAQLVSGTNVKTVNNISLLGSGNIDAKVANVVTATTATTLTATPTLLSITPASYGVTVTLPDATTCSEGGPLHIIDNKGAYPVRVENNAGTLIGFIYGGVVSHVSLIDNSTAAGVWSVENSELVGASAQLVTDKFACLGGAGYNCTVQIDANREFIYGKDFTNNYPYGVVYDKSTNTFGAVVLLRTAAGAGAGNFYHHQAILAGTDSILYVSVPTASTAMEAVVLSISGTTITVNTPATATLSANISGFTNGCGLLAIPSVPDSFVTSYIVATPAAQIRAISVSGTTVTVGSAEVLDGTADGLIAATGDKVIAVSTATTNLYTKPYTVSGSTLSAGTGTTTAGGTMTLNKLAPLGTRWVVIYNDGGTTVRGGVVSLSGTTTTISAATLFSAGAINDAIVIGSNKVLVLNNQTTLNANILTDTAGTASAGTAITLSSQTARSCVYVDGTDVVVRDGTTTCSYFVVDCSGGSPILQKTICNALSSTITPVFSFSNSVLQRDPVVGIYGQKYARGVSRAAAIVASALIKDGTFTLDYPPSVHYGVGSDGAASVGRADRSDSMRWHTTAANALGNLLVKIELATGALS